MDKKQVTRLLARRSMAVALAATMAASSLPTVAIADTLSEDATAQAVAADQATQLLPNPSARPSLADGTYTVNVETRNAGNPDAASMSNGALAREAKLVVSGDSYTLTLDFNGMDAKTLLGSDGSVYLGAVSYYDAQSGSKVAANVVDVQKDGDGNPIQDDYSQYLSAVGATAYPDHVEIPLDKTSVVNNYFKLGVFVPVMEALGGYGSQDALLNVDWSSAKLEQPAATPGTPATPSTPDTPVTPGTPTTPNQPVTPDTPADPADTTQLSLAIIDAKVLTQGTKSDEAYQALQQAIRDAQKVLGDKTATQDSVDKATDALSAAIKAFRDSPSTVDKSKLQASIESAKKAEQGKKGKDAYAMLQVSIKSAELIATMDVDQATVDTEVKSLELAVASFNAMPDEEDDAQDQTKLDKDKLENGTYYVSVSSYKATDHSALSMSDKSFDHTAKLEVTDGTGAAGEVNGKSYKLTLDFQGMQISGKTGYLGGLSYYENGYTIGDTSVTGTTTPAEVLSVQKDASGNPVTDDYTSLLPSSSKGQYPDQVRFPIYQQGVDEADGFVPVQVFVPVMESIAAGTGTQTALLKIDWSTLTTDESKVPSDPDEDNENGDETDKPGYVPVTTTKPATKPASKATLTGTAATALKKATTAAKRLPQTSDPTTVGAIIAAAVAGVGGVTTGVVMRLRGKKNK